MDWVLGFVYTNMTHNSGKKHANRINRTIKADERSYACANGIEKIGN